jgi:hypothetical protein
MPGSSGWLPRPLQIARLEKNDSALEAVGGSSVVGQTGASAINPVGCDGSGRIIPYSGRIVPQQALELTIMQCAGRWQVFHGPINGGFLGSGQDQDQGFELWALKSRI